MATLGSPGMGIGRLGSGNLTIKKPFQFEFTITTASGVIPAAYVRMASKPKLQSNEIEIPFLNEISYINGRSQWQTMDVQYMDVNDAAAMVPLHNWIASNYNYADPSRTMGSRRADYEGTGLMYIYDGCGNIMESWTYNNMFIVNTDFGEVNYDSGNEYSKISLTLRYSNVRYQSFCPAFQPQGTCSPCR